MRTICEHDGGGRAPLRCDPAHFGGGSRACTVVRAMTSASPIDVEQAYFSDLAAIPRFDRDRELELARAVVHGRRAMWAALLAGPCLRDALEVLAGSASDGAVIACAHASSGRPDIGPEDCAELFDALDRVGDEHGAADAIVRLAAQRDPSWHRTAAQAQRRFLAARGRFVHANLRLVLHFAKRYGRSSSFADRIQEGNIGLMKAADRFDPERGVRFSTYAAWWIRHAIRRSVERLDRVDRISLDGEDGDGDRDCLRDESSLERLEAMAYAGDHAAVMAAVETLSERERDILRYRFDLPGAEALSFVEIGARHGVSRERARQLTRDAIATLRQTFVPEARRSRCRRSAFL